MRKTADNKAILDIHADDYALSVHNSERFLKLLRGGHLDSISVIPNMSSFAECMEMLQAEWPKIEKKPLVTVHLNIADGYSLAGITDPFLTREVGAGRVFSVSWGQLFLSSFIPGRRNAVRAALTKEFAKQIPAVYDLLPPDANPMKDGGTALRLDSHTHTHMIPVVFDAMMDAVQMIGLTDRLTWVRVSKEPVMPFLRIANTCAPVNFVKNLLLNILSHRAIRRLDAAGVSHGILWGLIMSGEMDIKRVRRILGAMTDYAAARGQILEILFHPGIVGESEVHPEYCEADRRFTSSPKRDVEYEAVTSVRQ